VIGWRSNHSDIFTEGVIRINGLQVIGLHIILNDYNYINVVTKKYSFKTKAKHLSLFSLLDDVTTNLYPLFVVIMIVRLGVADINYGGRGSSSMPATSIAGKMTMTITQSSDIQTTIDGEVARE
jgi:hypothetical protein